MWRSDKVNFSFQLANMYAKHNRAPPLAGLFHGIQVQYCTASRTNKFRENTVSTIFT